MGLTRSSLGRSLLRRKKQGTSEKTVGLAGNPNVGKSTIFNALTGMNQHTGNWPGKTVTSASGRTETEHFNALLVDIPGTYSLLAHSAEEEVARNFICFSGADAHIVVCDATCLERNLGLVLQTAEITGNIIVCLNLCDEAEKKQIEIDEKLLSERLGVPVVKTVARRKKTLGELKDTLDRMLGGEIEGEPVKIDYPEEIERAVGELMPLSEKYGGGIDPRWLSLRLLENDRSLMEELERRLNGFRILSDAAEKERQKLSTDGDKLKDIIVSSIIKKAEEITSGAVKKKEKTAGFGGRADRLITGKFTAFPIMLLLLSGIFWLTITGANYPSGLLSDMFSRVEGWLYGVLTQASLPQFLCELLCFGVFRVLSWVVSVMLPPMAIFFPLFTLLEDVGLLPRIAYNLDKPFKKCSACGKQSLTMCMGLGCNAAGVVGCRIIDSPRERLMAIATNSLVPCNGRFPAIISMITMFFIGTAAGAVSSLLSALILCAVLVLGIFATFGLTFFLSKTLLRGVPSSFTLEMPPYRKPEIGKVIVRSVFDRTLFVLGRAAVVAAPAGLVIFLLANLHVGEQSILVMLSSFLNPVGKLMGLDGVILLAFILGFPANEIVLPLIIMAYMSGGTISEAGTAASVYSLLTANGWTVLTAVNFIIFSLMHWPCSTTLLTIKKETGSIKWTFLSAILPTAMGFMLCVLTNLISGIFA